MLYWPYEVGGALLRRPQTQSGESPGCFAFKQSLMFTFVCIGRLLCEE